jgi:hypothetical protein
LEKKEATVISYSDEIRRGVAPVAWTEADRRLTEALHAVGQEFGDQVHTSGPVDYLVRFLVNPTEIAVQEQVPNYFLVIVSDDGINTVTRMGDEQATQAGKLKFQEPWIDEIRDRFRDFRQRLG